jgi:hypothetical protein
MFAAALLLLPRCSSAPTYGSAARSLSVQSESGGPLPAVPCAQVRITRRETSPIDHVVDPGDHRLARIGSEFGHDRKERRPECLECLLGLPDVEHLDLPVRLKREWLERPSGAAAPASLSRRRARARQLERAGTTVAAGDEQRGAAQAHVQLGWLVARPDRAVADRIAPDRERIRREGAEQAGQQPRVGERVQEAENDAAARKNRGRRAVYTIAPSPPIDSPATTRETVRPSVCEAGAGWWC